MIASFIIDIKKTQIVETLPNKLVAQMCYEFQFIREPPEHPINLFFKRANGKASFYTGLLPQVKLAFNRSGYDVKLYDRRPKVALSSEYVKDKIQTINSILKKKKNSWLRPYQENAISLGLRFGHGVFQIATGGGKGLIFASIIKIYAKKTMILVDSVELMNQIADELSIIISKKLIGKYGAGIKSPNKYTVGIIDSVVNNRSVMDGVEYIVTDEAHCAAATTFRKVILDSSAYIRHGFTGTYTRSLATELNLLYSVTGPCLCNVTCSDLIESHFLSRPHISLVAIPKGEGKFAGISREIQIRKFIIHNKLRNKVACEFAKFHYHKNRKIVIFVSRVAHGYVIKKMLEEDPDVDAHDVRYVHGGSGDLNRKEALVDLEKGKCPILIATKIFEKGINIPTVDVGINLKGEYTEIGCKQTIGRILRGSSKCYYLDFIDHTTGMLKAFSNNRHKIYCSETAFRIKHYKAEDMLNGLEKGTVKIKRLTKDGA